MIKESFAVVTGASHGMGRCIAVELAKQGHHLILVSLAGEGLPELCGQLQEKYGVQVLPYETDLCERQNVLNFAKWVNDQFAVNILINNAGMGGSRKFTEVSSDFILKILDLNVVATALLTHELLPNLLKQKEAFLLNVSSLAALTPIGYKTVYPASKAFVTSFTKGLHYELRRTNVHVCVAHPGPMKTTVENTIRLNKQGRLGRFVQATPAQNAQKIVNGLLKGKKIVVLNPLNYYVMRFAPKFLKTRMVSEASRREILDNQKVTNKEREQAKKDVEWTA